MRHAAPSAVGSYILLRKPWDIALCHEEVVLMGVVLSLTPSSPYIGIVTSTCLCRHGDLPVHRCEMSIKVQVKYDDVDSSSDIINSFLVFSS